MFIRLRKERFGYVLFDAESRTHHFVQTSDKVEQWSRAAIVDFIRGYYPGSEEFQYEFVHPPVSDLELAAPIGVYLEITQKCNLNCPHCYKPDYDASRVMQRHQKLQLIKELHDIGVLEIRLCGNEPTHSPDFFEVCSYAKELKLYVGVDTNAYFSGSDEEQIAFGNRIVELAPNFVVVSLDGNEETHDAMRKSGSYRRALRFIDQVAKRGLRRRINTVLTTQTLPQISHIGKIAHQYGCDVSFLPFRTIGKHTAMKEQQGLTKEVMYKAVQEIMGIRSAYPEITFLTYFDILGPTATYHHSMDFNKPCPARKNGFVTCEGDFYPCDFLRYMGDRFLCGNVLEDGLWNIWSTSQTLRNFQHTGHARCASCKFYMKQCYGGCICGSIASTGSPDDELCFFDLL